MEIQPKKIHKNLIIVVPNLVCLFSGLVFGGDDVEREFLVAFLDSGEIFWWGVIPFPVNEVVFAPEKISINAKIRVKAVACGASHCAVLSEDGEVRKFVTFACER